MRKEWDLEIERLEREREDAEIQAASLRDELKQSAERIAEVEAQIAAGEALAQAYDERVREAALLRALGARSGTSGLHGPGLPRRHCRAP